MKWDIKKMAKQILRHGQRLPDRRLIHPEREWLIGLGLFAVLVMAGAVYEIHNFNFYSQLDSKLPVESVTVETYKSGSAARVLDTYQQKREHFDSLVGQSRAEVDSTNNATSTDANTEESSTDAATVDITTASPELAN